jgi:hypothetical protein
MLAGQAKSLGKALASSVHVAVSWEEPLDGDFIEDLCSSFKNELRSLNGDCPDENTDDLRTRMERLLRRYRWIRRRSETSTASITAGKANCFECDGEISLVAHESKSKSK